jgi:outer membrane immunogenic protein
MKNLFAAAVAAVALCASPAFAQDQNSLSGVYLGVVGGFDSVKLSVDDASDSKNGFMYGLVAGYDFDLGNVVVGIETELADSGVSASETGLLVAGDRFTLSADRDIYVGARVGAKVSPNAMIYAKAGYTNAKVTLDYTDGTDSFSDSDTLDGFRIGAGVEYSFGRFSLRGEYRYSGYGEYAYDGVATGISADRHQVVAALIGKF